MNALNSDARYAEDAVRQTLQALFAHAGLDDDKAASVARALVEADMMGHATHGSVLTPWYLDAAVAGHMATRGEPETVSDRGGCVAWRGHRLPGAWLLDRGIDLALQRVPSHGVFTLTIAGCHHTGALAVYLERVTRAGLMPVLACSGPAATGVAPFGGTRGVFTPNPLAAGIPTSGDPVLLDISSSITTNNRARQLAKAGERFPAEWALDAAGLPTDDPAVPATGGGTLLPIGGLDHGHKGYGLALLVEALTQGLSGLGRHTRPTGTLMNVFLQVIDPGAFGGAQAFTAESDWLVEACRSNPPRPGVARVRLPGDKAMTSKRAAQADGVIIARSTIEVLAPALQHCGVSWPPPID